MLARGIHIRIFHVGLVLFPVQCAMRDGWLPENFFAAWYSQVFKRQLLPPKSGPERTIHLVPFAMSYHCC